MKIIRKTAELELLSCSLKEMGLKVGLVPTMGALHNGHASLVSKSVAQNDVTVVSVFVNPTQFNNAHDLETYPRTEDADAKLLEGLGANVVYMPTPDEVYPYPDTREFELGGLDQVMEGPLRPGHFRGVCSVVSRLFDIVKPNKAYFGEKDFQQLAIIRYMVKSLNYNIEIVPMPIIREESGLALSSRNSRLNEEQKKTAVGISKALFESVEHKKKGISLKEVKENVINTINSQGMEVEYYTIVDGNTLQDINEWKDSDYPVGLITVYVGEVRLIDNIKY